MGPCGAAMGAFKRADQAMRNRARSILKRRPNLKHKDRDSKPGRTFKARTRNSYSSHYAMPEETSSLGSALLSIAGLLIGALIFIVGVPIAMAPATTGMDIKKNIGSDLACIVLIGTPIFILSATWLVHLAFRKRA